jgi:hypothetical protein
LNPELPTVAQFALDRLVHGDEAFQYLPAILAHEARFRQFNIAGGFIGEPNWGFPNGWGIGQIDYRDNQVPAQYLWSWRDNMFKARDTLQDKINQHEAYMRALRTHHGAAVFCDPALSGVVKDFTVGAQNYTLSVRLSDIIKRYNGASGGSVNLNGSNIPYVWHFDPSQADCDGVANSPGMKWIYRGWTKIVNGNSVYAEEGEAGARNYVEQVLNDGNRVNMLP